MNMRNQESGVVGASRLGPTLTLAEMALSVFATTILEDAELTQDAADVDRLRERFPAVMSVHETAKRAPRPDADALVQQR